MALKRDPKYPGRYLTSSRAVVVKLLDFGGSGGIRPGNIGDIQQRLRATFKERLEHIKNLGKRIVAKSGDAARVQRDAILAEIFEGRTYVIRPTDHSLQRMKWPHKMVRGGKSRRKISRLLSKEQKNVLIRAIYARMMDEGVIDPNRGSPYASRNPRMQSMGHYFEKAIHWQNSGGTGTSSRGTSIFKSLVPVDDENKKFYGIKFSDPAARKVYMWLAYGNGRMVARGTFKDNFGDRIRNQFKGVLREKMNRSVAASLRGKT